MIRFFSVCLALFENPLFLEKKNENEIKIWISPMDRGTKKNKNGWNMVHTYGEHASLHAPGIRSFDCVCVSAEREG
jgi:hypothetical protein